MKEVTQGFLAANLVALCLVFVPLQAAAMDDSVAAPGSAISPTTSEVAAEEAPEQARRQALADAHGAEIADAILSGTVLKAMTMEQVLLARGEPVRKEAIPPDAALWHYADGEVAFADGKVTYVAFDPPAVRGAGASDANRSLGAPPHSDPPTARSGAGRDAARVDTPGDGFLALRSEPTTRSGKRLLKIPHNTILTLDECINGPDDGRWCQTSFQGQIGWVFERYLVR